MQVMILVNYANDADADTDADEEDMKLNCASDDIGKCRADKVDDCSQIH